MDPRMGAVPEDMEKRRLAGLARFVRNNPNHPLAPELMRQVRREKTEDEELEFAGGSTWQQGCKNSKPQSSRMNKWDLVSTLELLATMNKHQENLNELQKKGFKISVSSSRWTKIASGLPNRYNLEPAQFANSCKVHFANICRVYKGQKRSLKGNVSGLDAPVHQALQTYFENSGTVKKLAPNSKTPPRPSIKTGLKKDDNSEILHINTVKTENCTIDLDDHKSGGVNPNSNPNHGEGQKHPPLGRVNQMGNSDDIVRDYRRSRTVTKTGAIMNKWNTVSTLQLLAEMKKVEEEFRRTKGANRGVKLNKWDQISSRLPNHCKLDPVHYMRSCRAHYHDLLRVYRKGDKAAGKPLVPEVRTRIEDWLRFSAPKLVPVSERGVLNPEGTATDQKLKKKLNEETRMMRTRTGGGLKRSSSSGHKHESVGSTSSEAENSSTDESESCWFDSSDEDSEMEFRRRKRLRDEMRKSQKAFHDEELMKNGAAKLKRQHKQMDMKGKGLYKEYGSARDVDRARTSGQFFKDENWRKERTSWEKTLDKSWDVGKKVGRGGEIREENSRKDKKCVEQSSDMGNNGFHAEEIREQNSRKEKKSLEKTLEKSSDMGKKRHSGDIGDGNLRKEKNVFSKTQMDIGRNTFHGDSTSGKLHQSEMNISKGKGGHSHEFNPIGSLVERPGGVNGRDKGTLKSNLGLNQIITIGSDTDSSSKEDGGLVGIDFVGITTKTRAQQKWSTRITSKPR